MNTELRNHNNRLRQYLAKLSKGRARVQQDWLDANNPCRRGWDVTKLPASHELDSFTWKYLNESVSFRRRPKAALRDYAAEASASRATESLRHLQYLALGGDAEAVKALADLAIAATNTLGRVSQKWIRPIACKRFFWPFLKARKERFGDKHQGLIKKIGLGCEAPFSELALSRIRVNNTVVRTAMMLLCRLESCRQNNLIGEYLSSAPIPEWKIKATRLKPFSKSTWPAWFEVAWQALLADHNGHPECDPVLKKIGLFRAEHSTEKYGGTQLIATPKTRNANIKDGIREQLKKAIRRLAEGPKKFKKK